MRAWHHRGGTSLPASLTPSDSCRHEIEIVDIRPPKRSVEGASARWPVKRPEGSQMKHVKPEHLDTLREADNPAAPLAQLILTVESGGVSVEGSASGRRDAAAD